MAEQKLDRDKIRQVYSRVVAIEIYLNKEYPHNVRKEVANSYTNLLEELGVLADEDFKDFKIPTNAFFVEGNEYCYLDLFLPKVIELKHFMETKFSFLKHDKLSLEIRIYLAIREAIVNFLKTKISK